MGFHNFRKKVKLTSGATSKAPHDVLLPADLEQVISMLKSRFGDNQDIVYRSFRLNEEGKKAAIVYIDELSDSALINQLFPRAVPSAEENNRSTSQGDLLAYYAMHFLSLTSVTNMETLDEIVQKILQGNTSFFIDGFNQALSISTSKWEKRSIPEPNVENEVRAPQEAFIEDLKTNVSLIRRRIQNEKLQFLQLKIGEITKTDVCISYLQDKADPSLVAEVKARLEAVQLESVEESKYLEECIVDHPYSIFPLIDHTERPDRVAGMLMEGRIAILTNGTPWVLIVPTVFPQLFSTAGDYYQNFYFATFLRWLRFVAFIFALTIPSFYIALITIHQEMIPTQLALRIAGSRSGVPFPAVVEALLMEVSFEILREAGIRLPKAAGQAVSIVGALIIGQAAVEAGIVSPIKVIVVSLTGISSFAIASYSLGLTVRLLRFPLMILASILGIPGITVAFLALLTYMASLKSFGVAYLSPLSPFTWPDIRDMSVRAPRFILGRAKHHFGKKDKRADEFEMEDEAKT
jgi:spore germination protein KA